MTITRRVLLDLRCDYPGCTDSVGAEDVTLDQLRAGFPAWYRRNGKDYCPHHADKARPAATSE